MFSLPFWVGDMKHQPRPITEKEKKKMLTIFREEGYENINKSDH